MPGIKTEWHVVSATKKSTGADSNDRHTFNTKCENMLNQMIEDGWSIYQITCTQTEMRVVCVRYLSVPEPCQAGYVVGNPPYIMPGSMV